MIMMFPRLGSKSVPEDKAVTSNKLINKSFRARGYLAKDRGYAHVLNDNYKEHYMLVAIVGEQDANYFSQSKILNCV